jgi:hypothetical protein
VLSPATRQVLVVVQPGDMPGPESSPWGTVVRAITTLLVLAVLVVGFRRRRQLADLAQGLRRPWTARRDWPGNS